MAGNINVIRAKEDFVKVQKGIVRGKAVDPFSLGIYVTILVLGDTDWHLNIKGLSTTLGLTCDRIRRAFSVLEAAGYLRRQRVRDENNHFTGWDYEVGEIPFADMEFSRHTENPDVGKFQHSENPDVGDSRNTGKSQPINKTITESKTIKENTRQEYTKSATRFIVPTLDEVTAYCQERGNGIDPQSFIDHYTSNGWMVGKTKMKDWKAAIRTWEARRRENPTPQAPRPERRYISPEERTLNALARLQARDGMLHTFTPEDQ